MFQPAQKQGNDLSPNAGDGGKGQGTHVSTRAKTGEASSHRTQGTAVKGRRRMTKTSPWIQGEVSLSRSFFSPRYPHLRVCSYGSPSTLAIS